MSRAGVTVRHVAEGDRAGWEALWQGYLDFYRVELAPGVTERTWARLNDPQFDMHGLIALDGDGAAIGLCTYLFHASTWAHEPYCYLEDLYVDETARGQGAGRALIEMVYAAADRRGAPRVYWMTHETNETARRLYDSVARMQGFVRYDR